MTRPGSALPRSGDVLHVTRAASVQFVEPILFRVIRAHAWPTYDGWIWLDGYELTSVGDATRRRSIFVQRAGLEPGAGRLQPRPQPQLRPARAPARNERVMPPRMTRGNIGRLI